MTVTNIILLAASGALLLFGLISLIVTLAKKSYLFKKIIAAVLAVAGLTATVISGLNILSVYQLTEQQNYVACELLELESYESGRDMAELANERVNNENSAKIISLSLAFSGDTELCSKVAKSFLANYPGSEDLETIIELADEFSKAEEPDYEAYKEELCDILDGVRSDVNPKDVAAAEDVAQALSLLEKGYYVDDDGEEVNGTKKASSIADGLDQNEPMTLQLQAKIAAQKGDEKEAFQYLEKLVKKDAITSNKIALAAAAVNGGYTDKDSGIEKDIYQSKIKSLEKQADKLEDKIDDASKDEKPALEAELAGVNAKIGSLEDTIENLDLLKAVNYVTSLLSDSDTTAANAVLAEIYYLMDDVIKAEEYSSKVFAANLTDDINERLTVDVIRIVEHHDEYGMTEGQYDVTTQVSDLIYKAHMGCTEYQYSGETDEDGNYVDNFASFLSSTVNSAVNAIKIGDVTTVDLQNFEVSVNVSRENPDGVPYTKEDFAIFDMGVQVTDYTMTTNSGSETSVCLVFDNSGSMDYGKIEQAKNAVTGFIANVNSNVEVGLVRFDDTSEILCNVTGSTGQVTRAALELQPSGGTDIPGGLRTGIEALRNCSGNKIIILLTDGEDGNASQMPETIEMLKREGIVVYSVGFGDASADYLGGISEQTGGQLLYAQNTEELQEMYRIINGFISNDYTFTFKTASDSDAYERTVRIVMPDGYYDEIDYTVGLSKEEVEAVINSAPQSDFYQQIGGSNKNGGINQ